MNTTWGGGGNGLTPPNNAIHSLGGAELATSLTRGICPNGCGRQRGGRSHQAYSRRDHAPRRRACRHARQHVVITHGRGGGYVDVAMKRRAGLLGRISRWIGSVFR